MGDQQPGPAGTEGRSEKAAAKSPPPESTTQMVLSLLAPRSSGSRRRDDGQAGGITGLLGTERPAAPQSPEDAAMAMLRNTDIVGEIQEDIPGVGVAGEEILALLIYLIGTSRLLDYPLAAVVQGPSAAGKSYLTATVSELFPKDDVIQAHRITPQALVDIKDPDKALVHKFVVGGERSRRRDPEATRTLRELLADRHTSVLRKGERIDVQGPIGFIESTTLEPSQIFGEDLNRCLLLKVDASAEQTKRVQIQMAERVKTSAPADIEPIKEKHRVAQAMLKRCHVYIPYADHLAKLYPDSQVEMRRSFRHLLSLIQTIALLRQYQKTADPEDGMALAADLNDYELARCLLAMPKNSGLSERVAATYQMLFKLGAQFCTTEVAAAMKRDYADTSDAIRELKDSNLIRMVTPPRGRRPALYELVPSEDGLDLPARKLLEGQISSQTRKAADAEYHQFRLDMLLKMRGYDVPLRGATAPSAGKAASREADESSGDEASRS